MSITWKIIADHLRRELADYGGLLHLYDQQQQGLFNRQADTVLRLSTAIEEQVVQVAESRHLREQAVEKFATAHNRPANTTLRDLLPLIEPDAQPLLEAIDRRDQSFAPPRAARTNRQNHTLLSRTVTLHRETQQQNRPNAFTKTYTPGGMMTVSSGRPPSTLCVAG